MEQAARLWNGRGIALVSDRPEQLQRLGLCRITRLGDNPLGRNTPRPVEVNPEEREVRLGEATSRTMRAAP
jgi:hypothetical protein